MRKWKIGFLLFLCFLVVVIFFASRRLLTKEGINTKETEEETNEISKTDDIESKVDKKIAEMTLEEKIGQMMMISYEKEDQQELKQILNRVKPGGFVLFSKNVTTYQDTLKWIQEIKKTASIPMLIGVDQEGGRVQRIKTLPDKQIQRIPSMLEVGSKADQEQSYQLGKTVAKDLISFGIQMNFAPVLDIFSNPSNQVIGDRAFGKEADTVIQMALPFARGMESEHVIPVYKHFPGHGDTKEDSHNQLPVVMKTKKALYEKEFLPFQAAIQEGAAVIMVAHIAYPNITGNNIPASLSKDMIDEILRKELGFEGVVMTDAINMKALQDNYSLEEICKKSIQAGADMLLMPPDPIQTLETMIDCVKDGTILEGRMDESVKRILTLKYHYHLEETD